MVGFHLDSSCFPTEPNLLEPELLTITRNSLTPKSFFSIVSFESNRFFSKQTDTGKGLLITQGPRVYILYGVLNEFLKGFTRNGKLSLHSFTKSDEGCRNQFSHTKELNFLAKKFFFCQKCYFLWKIQFFLVKNAIIL